MIAKRIRHWKVVILILLLCAVNAWLIQRFSVSAAGETLTIDAPVVFSAGYTISSAQFIDSANSTYFLDPAATGNSLVTAGDATVSGNIALGNTKTIRSAFGPLSLQYKSGLDAWTTGLTLQDTTGNVGIGTTTPAQKLSVVGTIESTTGGFKFPDGTIQTTADTVVRLGSIQIFTSGTSATYTRPANTSYIVVEVWGGGGGGGGYNAANNIGGGGGGGGGYSLKTIANPNSTYTYTVGAGGGGSTGNGTSGNTSSFDTVSSTGGALGCGGGACGSGGDGGIGGSGSGGDINISGQNGVYGDRGSNGGSAPRGGSGGGGGGPGGGGVTHNGIAGGSFGGGGGGGGNGGTSGGNGGGGGIVVYEYKTIATGTDLAENYPVTDPNISVGDIVSFDSVKPIGVKKASAGDYLQLAGIISSQPGLLLTDTIGADAVGQRPVALSGRVPTKVNLEGGVISIGDRITPSSIPGVGMKARPSDTSVGVALEPFSDASQNGSIIVFINLQLGTDASKLTVTSSGNVGIGTTTPSTALQVVGTITGTTKNFEIDHPTKPGMKLIHSTVEGPEVAVFYRGETRLVNGKAVVTLPEYFEALTRKEGRTVQLTAKNSWSPLYVDGEATNGRFTVKADSGNGSQQFFWEVKAVRKDVAPLQVEKSVN